MDFTEIAAILSIFIGSPSIVFLFIYHSKKNKLDLDKLAYQRDILQLEVEKERLRLAALEEENRKYDRLINERPTE